MFAATYMRWWNCPTKTVNQERSAWKNGRKVSSRVRLQCKGEATPKA